MTIHLKRLDEDKFLKSNIYTFQNYCLQFLCILNIFTVLVLYIVGCQQYTSNKTIMGRFNSSHLLFNKQYFKIVSSHEKCFFIFIAKKSVRIRILDVMRCLNNCLLMSVCCFISKLSQPPPPSLSPHNFNLISYLILKNQFYMNTTRSRQYKVKFEIKLLNRSL